VCGDGERCEELEFCDDGFTDACGSCNADCSAAGAGSVCGDGERCEELEVCDDGFTDACGSCNADCSAAGTGSVCGDGQVCEQTEACDDGDASDCGSCNASCSGGGSDTPSGACADVAKGVFAVRLELDVWWQDDVDPPLIDPGRDSLVTYAMAQVDEVQCGAGIGPITLSICGVELPVTKSDANCDAFKMGFADALWDTPSMPSFVTSGTRGLEVADEFVIDAMAQLLGIQLNDSEGAWPTAVQTGLLSCPAGSGASCFPDHDNDGKPGITATMMNISQEYGAVKCGGWQLPFVFRGYPLDALNALDDNGVKAEELYIGLRLRAGARASIGADCQSGSGECEASWVDMRAWDCSLTDGSPCSAAGAQFVDEQMMDFQVLRKDEAPPPSVTVPATQGGGPLDQTPSPGPLSSIVRLGDTTGSFSCADVRAAGF